MIGGIAAVFTSVLLLSLKNTSSDDVSTRIFRNGPALTIGPKTNEGKSSQKARPEDPRVWLMQRVRGAIPAFLAARGSSTEALIAASLVCSDASILEQLKLRSNEPSAALALVKLLPASEALLVLTKSIDSGCRDPAVLAAAVGLAKQSNDLATSARMASLLSSGGPLDGRSSERSAMVRQLLLVSGMSSEETWSHAFAVEADVSGSLLKAWTGTGQYLQSRVSGSAGEELYDAVSSSVGFARSMIQKPQGFLETIVSASLEEKALSFLPPDTPYGDGGETVDSRIKEIARIKGEFSAIAKSQGDLFETVSESDRQAFYQMAETDGELEAMRWLSRLANSRK